VGGHSEISIAGQTVGEVLLELGSEHPGFLDRILDGDGKPRAFVNLYLGDQNVRTLGGLDTPVGEGKTLHIVPAVAGGAGR
jgi:molybdopterin converting factor small subunit